MRHVVRPLVLALVLGCSANSRGGGSLLPTDDVPGNSIENDASSVDVRSIDRADATALDAPPDVADDRALPPMDVTRADVATDVNNRYDVAVSDGCDASGATCTPRPSGCASTERCNDGLDNNCDGRVDEGCPCVPGAIQTCFLGPPGARAVGVCSDGTQRCTGVGEFGTLDACIHSISPSPEVCDRLDNDCDGCVDEDLCCDGPADGLCRATLIAGTVTPTMATCFVDEVVSRNNPGSLVYRCRGGEASATFGTHTFMGSYMGGTLDVRLTTTFHFSDGCDWVSTQRIYGDPHAPTLQYDYQEAIAPGQRGCATACGATATVSVRP